MLNLFLALVCPQSLDFRPNGSAKTHEFDPSSGENLNPVQSSSESHPTTTRLNQPPDTQLTIEHLALGSILPMADGVYGMDSYHPQQHMGGLGAGVGGWMDPRTPKFVGVVTQNP